MDADFLLIRKIEKGNEQAMDQFVLKHYPKIYQKSRMEEWYGTD